MEHKKIRLIDCCKSISDGDHLPPPKSQSGVPFITISNIGRDNIINFEDTMFVSEGYYDTLPKEKKAQVGDILYSVVGSFGKPVYIDFEKKFVFQRHIAILKPNNTINPRYLYYVMLNPDFYYVADKMAIGAAQRTITLDSLRNICINLHDMDMQSAIVDVLSSVDRKIQCNKKINDNLQQMSVATYMHLFYGKKCNGRLGDILVENAKSTIQVGEAKDKSGDYPFFTSGDAVLRWTEPIVDGRNIFLNTGGNADVKFYVGATSYSTDTWCITAKDDMEDYLYLLLNSIKQELNLKFFQGTGLKHLQKPLLKDKVIYIPSKEEISSFNADVKSWLSMISDNTRESYRLSALRDWLLPMLMNGQATISD